MPDSNASALLREIEKGDRRTLTKCISLLESSIADDNKLVLSVIEQAAISVKPNTWRIGISGPPGSGKSSIIELLGMHFISQGKKVAVLAVDPTSHRTGGSVMGDKLRMPKMAISDSAFVRPSPSKTALGGVTPSTPEVVLLCEQAGFDIVIIETVGVGQSEVDLADMVDCFILIALPDAGDDVQAMKKGIMEEADLFAVNKSDINTALASKAVAIFNDSLTYASRRNSAWVPKACAVNTVTPEAIRVLESLIEEYFASISPDGLQKLRCSQSEHRFNRAIEPIVMKNVMGMPAVKTLLQNLRKAVAVGELMPLTALHHFENRIIRFFVNANTR